MKKNQEAAIPVYGRLKQNHHPAHPRPSQHQDAFLHNRTRLKLFTLHYAEEIKKKYFFLRP